MFVDFRSQKEAIDATNVVECALMFCLVNQHSTSMGQLYLNFFVALEAVLDQNRLGCYLIKHNSRLMHLFNLLKHLYRNRSYFSFTERAFNIG